MRLSLAGFQVIMYGRFWVITEGTEGLFYVAHHQQLPPATASAIARPAASRFAHRYSQLLSGFKQSCQRIHQSKVAALAGMTRHWLTGLPPHASTRTLSAQMPKSSGEGWFKLN